MLKGTNPNQADTFQTQSLHQIKCYAMHGKTEVF